MDKFRIDTRQLENMKTCYEPAGISFFICLSNIFLRIQVANMLE